MSLNTNEIQIGKFLPLLDMSSKSLLIQGNEGFLPVSLKARQLYQQMDISCRAINNSKGHKFAKPSHINHKSWCSFARNSKCNCQLYNPLPPKETLVRVECTKGKINGFVEYAQCANENGAYHLTNSILHCFEAQKNMEMEERANTMVYPVLNTKWNHQVGEDTMLKVKVPEIQFKRITSPKKQKPILKRKLPEKDLSLLAMAEFYPKEHVTEDISLLEQAKQIEQQRQEKRERITEKIRLQKEKAKQIQKRLQKRKVFFSNRAAKLQQEEEQKKLLEAQEKKLRQLEMQKERRSSVNGTSRRKKSRKSIKTDSQSQLNSNTDRTEIESNLELSTSEDQLVENSKVSQTNLDRTGNSPDSEKTNSDMVPNSSGNDESISNKDTLKNESAETTSASPTTSTEKVPPKPDAVETAAPVTDLSSDPESVLKLDSSKKTADGEHNMPLEDDKQQILNAVETLSLEPSSAGGNSDEDRRRRASIDLMNRHSITEETILRANYRSSDEIRPGTEDIASTSKSNRGGIRPYSSKLSIASGGELSRKNSLRNVVRQARKSIGSEKGYYMDADGVIILADDVQLDMEQQRYQDDIETQIANLRDIIKVKKQKPKIVQVKKEELKKKVILPKAEYNKEYILERESNVDRRLIKFGLDLYKKKTLKPFVTSIPVKKSNVEYSPPKQDSERKYIGRPEFASQNQFLYTDSAYIIDFEAAQEESEDEEEDLPYVPPEDPQEIQLQGSNFSSTDNFY
ncbi:hypothetical protein HDV01_006716 [Terramyces sp. JEL0728]|nr:hypothetical protein HDV01_006716 [Terramyces sp. JEL0728]